ncbi:FAD-dependent oxidoreductase [Chloroflexota bacterium]
MIKNESELTWKDLKIGSIVTEPGSASQYETGGWRSQRPIYFQESETVSPCEMYCPINQDIRKWQSLVREEKFKEAWQTILEKNPFPAVQGRVCPHFCENNCNRKDFDEPVATQLLEKFLGDEALRGKWSLPVRKITPKTAKIAIAGSGPAGLSCAYQLAREGYKVTIFEELPVIGGMLRVGIPEYRLAKTVLTQEIENNIISLGIEVKENVKVDDSVLDRISQEFDAIFIAVGAQKSVKLNIDGEAAKGVISGLDFLKKINLGQPLEVGKEVAVIGGGNTAIDAAHSALRLGAKVTIFYRRGRKEMPAIEEEVKAAEEAGVRIQTLASPVKIITQNGQVAGLECVKMTLGEKDESGRARPIPVENSNFSYQTDMVIAAVGEESRLDFKSAFEKNPKIFNGEVVGTVAAAIKSGEKAARQIISYLTKGERISLEEGEQPKVIEFKDLNINYFEPQARQSKIADRQSAIKEAQRCFDCGLCTVCGNCWLFCPDSAILEVDEQYQINYDYCKGCGICAEECPHGAIFTKEEQE